MFAATTPEYVPAAQGRHVDTAVAPGVVEYRPASHAAQVDESFAATCPE